MTTRKLSRRCAVTSFLLAIIAIASSPRAVATEVVDGPALMQKVRDDIAWVGKLKSFHLMARIEERRTPEGIENSLRRLRRAIPDLEQPDPLWFTQLLPETNMRLELDFDARRMRMMCFYRDATNRDLERSLQMWDGVRCVERQQNFHRKKDFVWFRRDATRASDVFWDWIAYFEHQPLDCWWVDDPMSNEQRQIRYPDASDFAVVDREDFHGVDCHVLLETRNEWRDRYYVGVKDGRWYGFKWGVTSFANFPNFPATHQRLFEEFLGRSLGATPSDQDWEAVQKELTALPLARRVAWGKRLYSEVGKRLIPWQEYRFSDFRDQGEGRFLPFRETCLSYGHDGEKKIFISNQRTLFVRKLTLNQPLDDSLFEEAIADGAEIVDETTKAK